MLLQNIQMVAAIATIRNDGDAPHSPGTVTVELFTLLGRQTDHADLSELTLNNA